MFNKAFLKIKLLCRNREDVPIHIAWRAGLVPFKATFKQLHNNSVQYLSCGNYFYEVSVHKASSTWNECRISLGKYITDDLLLWFNLVNITKESPCWIMRIYLPNENTWLPCKELEYILQVSNLTCMSHLNMKINLIYLETSWYLFQCYEQNAFTTWKNLSVLWTIQHTECCNTNFFRKFSTY